jgi:hypothetical protein
MQRRLVVAGACGLVVGASLMTVVSRVRAHARRPAPPAAATDGLEPAAQALPAAEAPSPVPPDPPLNERVHLELRNVDLQMAGGLSIYVQRLQGLLVSTRPGQEAVFDDPDSFVIKARSADVRMSLAMLDKVMNERVFDYQDADVEKIRSRVNSKGKLEQKGKLDKGIDVPFKVKGELSATADGRIRFHGQSTKALHLPVKPLMKLFSIEMDDMVKVKPGRGVEVVDNDFIIDPSLILPPPRLLGPVTGVRLDGDGIVLHIGGGEVPRNYEAPVSPNHVYFNGGNIRFGKLSMHGADLELIDQDPRDSFKFSVPRYNDQLVAGYSKNTSDRGLKTYMPDIDGLNAAAGPAPAKAESKARRSGRRGRGARARR